MSKNELKEKILKLLSHIIIFAIFTLMVLFVLILYISYPFWFWRVDTKKIQEGLKECFELIKEMYAKAN